MVRLCAQVGVQKSLQKASVTDAQAEFLRAAGVPYPQVFVRQGLPADILESRLSEEMVSHSRVAGRA